MVIKEIELNQEFRVGKGRESVAGFQEILVTSLGALIIVAFDELVSSSGQGVALEFGAQLHDEVTLVYVHFLKYFLFVPVSPIKSFFVFQLYLRHKNHS